MKRFMWIAIACAVVGAAGIWAAIESETHQNLASLMPDGALLYLESKDFHALLNDWNTSEEKRTWLKGDDYAAFSRSRLFERLSQARDEFSTAASLTADSSLLSSVAGKQSALALYDIGKLEFVYVTRMDDAAVQATPLWQMRAKFEQRSEGTASFYLHKDTQSNRTAEFAARDGWFVLGTREDLVAGVLDHIEGLHANSLPDEAWFADALRQAKGPVDDLRMVLNLEKIVPSPYFRSYWVQRNVTEMKQYRAALCDLHRTPQRFLEDRVLLRKPNINAAASGDVQALVSLAPEDAVWYSAQASPNNDHLLSEMRENLLDLKSAQSRVSWTAPSAVQVETAGNASMLEQRIDVAPVIAQQSDPYQSLRTVLESAQPAAMLEVYSTRSAQGDMFVNIDRAMVIEAAQNWDEARIEDAIATALRAGLTASQLGLEWKKTASALGDYSSIDGRVHLYVASRDRKLYLSTDAGLMEQLLARQQKVGQPRAEGITYAAVFRHSAREQKAFRKLVDRLDTAGHTGASGGQADQGGDAREGQQPSFFSGNIASLSWMFKSATTESIEEKDEGSQVLQTVIYQWQHS